MKRLNDTVESAKRDSLLRVKDDEHRTSLISELDPSLIHYMSRYADHVSSEETSYDDAADTSVDPSTTKRQPEGDQRPSVSLPVKPEAQSKSDIQSLGDTDEDSIHLFNMRISQRLASQSHMQVLSPATSNNNSTKSLAANSAINHPAYGQGSVTNLSRYPARIAVEHNRRPSDPQTRRLFESQDRNDKPHKKDVWKTVTSVHSGSTSFDPTLKFHRFGGDDGSSLYFNDRETGGSQLNSPDNGSRRSSSHNAHSLAVGGRSISSGCPTHPEKEVRPLIPRFRLQNSCPSQENSRCSEDSWTAPGNAGQRGRSASMPQRRSQVQQASPTPTPKHLRGNTDNAEGLSEISLERVLDRRNEGITEISAEAVQEKRDEKLSEIDHRLLAVPNISRTSSGISPRDNRPSAGHTNDHSARNGLRRSSVSNDTFAQGIREGASSVWGKAFREAREDPRSKPIGGFLTAPRFDRDGRRRSDRTTTSNDESIVRTRERSVSASPMAQPIEDSRRSSASPDLDAHQRLCAQAKAPLPRASRAIEVADPEVSELRCQTTKEKQKPRKKGVVEHGKRFATVAVPLSEDKRSNTSTPIKDLLGIWARFPSHTRVERNGAATDKDGVRVKDFFTKATDSAPPWTPPNKSFSNLTPFASNTIKRLQTKTSRRLDKVKSKSMTFRAETSMILSPEERARRSRKGLKGKWKKLYRSSSSELRKYANARGHRSSFSVGDVPEYPELECLPGEGLLWETDLQRIRHLDGSADSARPPDSRVRNDDSTQAIPSSDKGVGKKQDAADWGRLYGECVGSLSALKSEDGDLAGRAFSDQVEEGVDARLADLGSNEVLHSTTDLPRQLVRMEQERARKTPVERVDRLEKNEDDEWEDVLGCDDEQSIDAAKQSTEKQVEAAVSTANSRLSKDLKVPGQFEE